MVAEVVRVDGGEDAMGCVRIARFPIVEPALDGSHRGGALHHQAGPVQRLRQGAVVEDLVRGGVARRTGRGPVRAPLELDERPREQVAVEEVVGVDGVAGSDEAREPDQQGLTAGSRGRVVS